MNAPFSPPNSTEPCSIETLYIENHAWLRNWLAYRLRSWGRGVADDLAQDTFLRVLASREGARVEPIRQPRAYLTRIANCVLVSWRPPCDTVTVYPPSLAATGIVHWFEALPSAPSGTLALCTLSLQP